MKIRLDDLIRVAIDFQQVIANTMARTTLMFLEEISRFI